LYTFLIFLIGISAYASGTALHSDNAIVTETSTAYVWNCPELIPLSQLPDNLSGYSTSGCGYVDGCLLPQKNLYFAVPGGHTPVLEVHAGGITRISPCDIAEILPTSTETDSFKSTDTENIPSVWGELSASGSWRRAGIAEVHLYPVILENGVFYTADNISVTLRYDADEPPEQVSGVSGSIFQGLMAGGNRVWQENSRSTDESPFWGHPWISIGVDTAGIYAVSGREIPSAVGSVSETLSLFCGRGREMGETPWENSYVPYPVPILVEDGDDGIFDEDDTIFFFARGLSWWEAFGDKFPVHYNHRYSDINKYWLTWGSENGTRMAVIDGELTGAPAMPDSFLSRTHFEENVVYVRDEISLADDWAWERSSGSQTQWIYHSFDSPFAAGSGYIRILLKSSEYIQHYVRLKLNGTYVADTTWKHTGDFILTVPVANFEENGNSLGIELVRDGEYDVVFLDWIDIFPQTIISVSGQAFVPLEWWSQTERQKFTWKNSLNDSRVYLVSGDTLAASVTLHDDYSFEFEIPEGWDAREFRIVPTGRSLTPVSIEEAAPGRILAVLDGADQIYVTNDEFYSEVLPLDTSLENTEIIKTSEIYDEFNGGVRDPQAIRTMLNHIIDTWNLIPADIVLVGNGNWDPKNYISSRKSLIDILYYGVGTLVSDDRFAVVGDTFNFPQMGVSRIAAQTGTDVQYTVSKTLSYSSGSDMGDWQTTVLACADDERSPVHGGDETYHTLSMENLLNDHIPDILRPKKEYLIFFDWNDLWKKPEAREDYIETWSRGALIALYLGHGGYDQIADEGVLYLEDTALLNCSGRLPYALFGSCNVGEFQNPAQYCIGQNIVSTPAGGAILCTAASGATSGSLNETFLASVLDELFREPILSVGCSVLLSKINAGYNQNTAQYILFGDGSSILAYPSQGFPLSLGELRSGELASCSGTAPGNGIILIESFESCQADTYYTFRQQRPIPYLSQASPFYLGSSIAVPDFDLNLFVPLDSDTGYFARTQFVYLGVDNIAASTTYPDILTMGTPAGNDTVGPAIELWIDGFRGEEHPSVSGEITVRAQLSDTSGINLLGNTGRQLALYLDGVPQDVSEYFRYNSGSATTGEVSVCTGTLLPGEHEIQLRASDGVLNRSTETLNITVLSGVQIEIENAFPYPNPCSGQVSINWTQSADGAVSLSIYTVAGTCILTERNIEGCVGYNQYLWNCNDAEGDAIASGSYIFTISVSALNPAGLNTTAAGIIALVRGD